MHAIVIIEIPTGADEKSRMKRGLLLMAAEGTEPLPTTSVRLAENSWSLDMQTELHLLGKLVQTAIDQGLKYHVLFSQQAPEWIHG